MSMVSTLSFRLPLKKFDLFIKHFAKKTLIVLLTDHYLLEDRADTTNPSSRALAREQDGTLQDPFLKMVYYDPSKKKDLENNLAY